MKKTCWLLVLLLFLGSPGLGDQSSPAARLLDSIQSYERAVLRHDLVATLKAQNEALESWRLLDREQKLQIEASNPGTFAWLEGGEAYDGTTAPRPRAGRGR